MSPADLSCCPATPWFPGAKIELDRDGARAFIHFKTGDVAFDIPKVKEDSIGKFTVPANGLHQEFGLQGTIFYRRENIDRDTAESCVSGYTSENKCDWKNVCETDNQGIETYSERITSRRATSSCN